MDNNRLPDLYIGLSQQGGGVALQAISGVGLADGASSSGHGSLAWVYLSPRMHQLGKVSQRR